jgi:hypothetical protein
MTGGFLICSEARRLSADWGIDRRCESAFGKPVCYLGGSEFPGLKREG